MDVLVFSHVTGVCFRRNDTSESSSEACSEALNLIVEKHVERNDTSGVFPCEWSERCMFRSSPCGCFMFGIAESIFF
jgi:hypothetical protein